MQFKKILVCTLTLSLFGLSGCQQTRGNNTTTGALIGGATGALAASHIGKGSGKIAATMLGAFAGAVIGSEVGQYLDEIDRAKADDAFQQAANAPVGRTIEWKNPNSGHHGRIVHLREGMASGGEYCREYQSEVTIGNKVEKAFGTACRRPDGSWEILNQKT